MLRLEVKMTPVPNAIWLDRRECDIVAENVGFATVIHSSGEMFRIANGPARVKLLRQLGFENTEEIFEPATEPGGVEHEAAD